MDPLGFLQYLNTFGSITDLTIVDEALPPVADFDAQKCYLGFEFAFETDATREKIVVAFEFVRVDCTLTLTPPASKAAAAGAPAQAQSQAQAAGASQTIRVDSLKLDSLITRIGEL